MKPLQFSIIVALVAAFALTAVAPAMAVNNVLVTNETSFPVSVWAIAKTRGIPSFSATLVSARERGGDHTVGGVLPIGKFTITVDILDPRTYYGMGADRYAPGGGGNHVPNVPSICVMREEFNLGSMEQLRFAVRLAGKTCSLQAI